MLTEYSSIDDIRKFKEKARDKASEIINGSLSNYTRRLLIKSKQNKKFIQGKEIFYSVDRQKVGLNVFATPTGEIMMALLTEVETDKGRMTYELSDPINVHTPHYRRRFKERIGSCRYGPASKTEVPYIRNGTEYRLQIVGDSVVVVKYIDDDFCVYVTFLHRKMCTSKNYQELFDRVGKRIDEEDVYEWK